MLITSFVVINQHLPQNRLYRVPRDTSFCTNSNTAYMQHAAPGGCPQTPTPEFCPSYSNFLPFTDGQTVSHTINAEACGHLVQPLSIEQDGMWDCTRGTSTALTLQTCAGEITSTKHSNRCIDEGGGQDARTTGHREVGLTFSDSFCPFYVRSGQEEHCGEETDSKLSSTQPVHPCITFQAGRTENSERGAPTRRLHDQCRSETCIRACGIFSPFTTTINGTGTV